MTRVRALLICTRAHGLCAVARPRGSGALLAQAHVSEVAAVTPECLAEQQRRILEKRCSGFEHGHEPA
jgi:hypothetical protein